MKRQCCHRYDAATSYDFFIDELMNDLDFTYGRGNILITNIIIISQKNLSLLGIVSRERAGFSKGFYTHLFILRSPRTHKLSEYQVFFLPDFGMN